MKQTVDFSIFDNAFRDMGRTDNFSYHARRALFDYLEELENDTGTETELDVVALCCDFSEFSSGIEAAKEYGFEVDAEQEEEEQEESALGWLRDNTTVIEFNGGLVIQGF